VEHATIEQSPPSEKPGLSRRSSLFATAFLASLGPVGEAIVGNPAAAQTAITDTDILNFALNLEYIEAEFYLRAATGQGLPATSVSGTGTAGGVNGGTAVPFTTPLFAQYAEALAVDEQNHVNFLRGALGSAAVARPLIDLAGGFNAAGNAIGVPGFNPFADQNSFFLGAFLFEDVGVSAYAGASALIQNKTYLAAAASILAVESYHGGVIRSVLAQQGAADWVATQAIANVRSQATGAAVDQGVVLPNTLFANIAPTDGNGLVIRRSTAQVINVVTLGNGSRGGFLPNGFNGTIR
jgi:hypothetical protein